MEGDVGVEGLEAIEFVGDVEFVVAGTEEEDWEGDRFRDAEAIATGNSVGNGGLGQLQKAGDNGAFGVEAGECCC